MRVLRYLFPFIIIVLLSACVENIETTAKPDRKVVVNCILKLAPIQLLTLTYTNAFEDIDYEEVEKADVVLYEDGKNVGNFHKVSYGKWELPFNPSEGHRYKLKVEIPGKPIITAETEFPYHANLIRYIKDDSDGKRGFVAYNNTNTFWVAIMNSDQYKTPITSLKPFTILSNIFTDYPYADNFNMERDKDDFGYYNYIRMLPKGEKVYFSLSPIYSYNNIVLVMSVSKEYDLYLKSSLEKLMIYRDGFNLKQLTDEESIYSNINNGIGIFGTYSDYYLTCASRRFK